MAIPSSLVAEFTRLAASNTSRLPYGVETCGILAGSLKDQRLSITTLIIPKQEGSSDTCIMTHEEDLFEYCIQHDLLTLGWIHAIAIVVAPRDPVKNVGVFRLTTPHGMELIQNCTLSGFHEHPSNVEIYSDAMQLTWDASRHAALVDMRSTRV
ncbi:hypothetical protein B5M09_004930 [Aphanomyces astaci]|uniref:JAB1/MPN/MOV34 metalloenzyme domain-containing protein n=1 Tax=Aphanomyces astaci TaxID=112090 RepID=A0A425CSU8_APHAT|nr:hypothetical protein B5M09_004930 [Aphanomyces astaci]